MILKRLVTYLVIAVILVVLPMGCGRQERADRAGLVSLDSLIAAAPDSAAALLEAYPRDSLRTADGALIHRGSGLNDVNVPAGAGIYLVVSGNQPQKVVVR